MRLYEQMRPKNLAGVVGQPHITQALQTFLLEPYPTIIMFEGPTGVGKSACAMALADALADNSWFGGSQYVETGAGFDVATVDHYFSNASSPFRYKVSAGKFHVLRIEELERLHPMVQNDMKEALEEAQRRYRVIVIATSNSTAKLEKALLHRFQRYTFDAGPRFALAFNEWLEAVWAMETGTFEMPEGWQAWGYEDKSDAQFSGRLALDRCEQSVAQPVQPRRGNVGDSMSKPYVPLWDITSKEPPWTGSMIRAASEKLAWKAFCRERSTYPYTVKLHRDDFTVKQVDESIYHRPVRQTSLFGDPLPLFETDS